jgi:hypothetical protein
MITNFKYSTSHNRTEVVDYLISRKFARVIDVGASAASWSIPHITHYADIVKLGDSHLIGFHGSICSYTFWEKILADVSINGKFDFAICSHTLEDISSPQLVCEMLPLIAKEGYIAVPSKFVELRNHEGANHSLPYLGYIHHRWIFNKEGNEFVAYPKLPVVEHIDVARCIFSGRDIEQSVDLNFFWADSFELKIVNGDFMGPGIDAVFGFYDRLQQD